MTIQKRPHRASHFQRRRHFSSTSMGDKGLFTNPATRTKRDMSKLECPDCEEEAPGMIDVDGHLIPCPTCGGSGDVRESEVMAGTR